jgi:TetR/AcrR family transcriptional regulator
LHEKTKNRLNPKSTARNPQQSQQRILDAALDEFAAHGFAGARVDVIARRARINKRMLYHYFGDKEGLFREMLRRKIAERQVWSEGLSGDPAESLPFWFEASCKDMQWARLLEWEALQGGDEKVVDEEGRRAAFAGAVEHVRLGQRNGQLTSEFDPSQLLLAMRSLTLFPLAFPQLTRLITGRQASDPVFQRERAEFLRRFAVAFRPSAKISSRKQST